MLRAMFPFNTFNLIGLVFCCCLVSSCAKVEDSTETTSDTLDLLNVYDLTYPLPELLVSGHRGIKNHDELPENCLETFMKLKSEGNMIIECDVLMTRDSILILMHDNTLERTTTGNGVVREINWSDMAQYKLITNKKETLFNIPRFIEILEWAVESKTILSVDIKRSVPVELVIDLIRQANATEYCMLISYTLNQAEKVYRLAPEFMQSVSVRNLEEHHRWKQSMIPPSRTIAFTGTRRSPAALYQKLHADGVACIFGTLGNIDAQAASQGDKIYIELIEEGVDIFATDRPLALLKILKAYKY